MCDEIKYANSGQSMPLLIVRQTDVQSLTLAMGSLLANVNLKIEKLYLTSRPRATIPAARGAAAEVPVWCCVHLL